MSTPRLAAAAAAIFLCGSTLSAPAPLSQIFTVDCAKGQTISAALERGDERKPLVLIIRGTCNENVTINRDDVTLKGDPNYGATVNGSSAADTIAVRASRVLIDRIAIRGGNPNGIALIGGSNIDITNSDVQSASWHGVFLTGTSAVNVVNCVVQNNARSGIGLSDASVAIADSQISHNSGSGVRAVRHSSVTVTASTISSNALFGIQLQTSEALISNTTIAENGTNTGLPETSRGGVGASASNLQINGSNIANNSAAGVVATGASTTNLFNSSVTGNGGSNGGVTLYLGAVGSIDGGTVSSNKSTGVFAWVNSTVQISGGATIQYNTGHGIQLNADSKLWMNGPATVGGNTWLGVNCLDTASSAYNLSSITYTPPNGVGTTDCK